MARLVFGSVVGFTCISGAVLRPAGPGLSTVKTELDSVSCDLQMPSVGGAVCVGSRALLPKAMPRDTVAFYSFDDEVVLDQSGKGNHPVQGATSAFEATAGVSGGIAATFWGNSEYIMVPTIGSTPEFAYSFWLRLGLSSADVQSGELKPGWCPLMRRGIDTGPLTEGGAQQFSPSIEVEVGNSRRKRVRAVLGGASQVRLVSQARLSAGVWYHVGVSKSSSALQLFVNGFRDGLRLLDAQHDAASDAQLPLYIGGDVSSAALPECSGPDRSLGKFSIDELLVQARPLDPDSVHASGSAAFAHVQARGAFSSSMLTNVGSFFQLGCAACPRARAKASCESMEGYRLCDLDEYQTGGIELARVMGWLGQVKGKRATLWSRIDTMATQSQASTEDEVGLGLCCSTELDYD